MRWDSPFVLSVAGTVAVHIVLIVSGDVLRHYAPPPPKPAPHIELINVEVPPPPPELPPPPPLLPEVKQPEPPPPEPKVEPKPEPKPKKIAAVETKPEETPAPQEDPIKPDLTPGPVAGGDAPVIKVDDLTGGMGTGTAHGSGGGGRGKGGRGGGTGTGTGTGNSSGVGEGGPPTPVSVATIKKRAMPKGDQSYIGLGKDYPAEAKQLGIEGTIKAKLVVDATGKVVKATLITKLGHGLDELALERATHLEFEPAISTDGTPVTSVVVWDFLMTLPK